MNERYPTWEEVRSKFFTPEEIAACDLRVASAGRKIEARLRGEIGGADVKCEPAAAALLQTTP
ncbi:MAG: hypothetical protein LBR38_09870 [Synergistaceae bacterium]|jgi:hypothetical protein|nr:hypothetical protein [Synergistaceae bacterium]